MEIYRWHKNRTRCVKLLYISNDNWYKRIYIIFRQATGTLIVIYSKSLLFTVTVITTITTNVFNEYFTLNYVIAQLDSMIKLIFFCLPFFGEIIHSWIIKEG